MVLTFAQEVLETARTVRRAFTSRSISMVIFRSTPKPEVMTEGVERVMTEKEV